MRTENLRTVPLEEIVNLPVYPVADIFPMLPKTPGYSEGGRKETTISLTELAGSINEYGLQEAIVLFTSTDVEGNLVTWLLDGRNRRTACEMIKSPDEFDPEAVPVEDFIGTEEEADEYVFTLNLDRRDLEPSQRAMAAVDYWEIEAERHPQGRPPKNEASLPHLPDGDRAPQTRDILAQRFRVSARLIQDARKRAEEAKSAQEAVESAQQEIEKQKAKKVEAQLELEAAKAAADAEAIREAAVKANNAALAEAEERERLEAKAEVAAKKQQNIDNVKTGRKTLNAIKPDNPGQNIDPSDPVPTALGQVNKAVNDLIKAFEVTTAIVLDKGTLVDRDNIRRKYIRVITFTEEFAVKFGDELGINDLDEEDDG